MKKKQLLRRPDFVTVSLWEKLSVSRGERPENHIKSVPYQKSEYSYEKLSGREEEKNDDPNRGKM